MEILSGSYFFWKSTKLASNVADVLDITKNKSISCNEPRQQKALQSIELYFFEFFILFF
jgi:hypothetical protein